MSQKLGRSPKQAETRVLYAESSNKQKKGGVKIPARVHTSRDVRVGRVHSGACFAAKKEDVKPSALLSHVSINGACRVRACSANGRSFRKARCKEGAKPRRTRKVTDAFEQVARPRCGCHEAEASPHSNTPWLGDMVTVVLHPLVGCGWLIVR